MTLNTDTLSPDILVHLATLQDNMVHAGGDRAAGLDLLYPRGGDRCELLVTCHPDDYSASRIARAVEDCDVHLVNLNLTSCRTPAGEPVIALRVDCAGADGVSRSLERYGYRVIASTGSRYMINEDESRRRAAELMHLLEI